MRASKLEIPCPTCGSRAVFYSCSPSCCFNHVCEDCTGTFQTGTLFLGEGPRLAPPKPLPDSTEPTAACARCQSTAVYQTDDAAKLACTDCGAALELELTEVAPPSG